ncbi:hypothetical protein AmDm5_2871 [Acetobacter malorum]|nr:hypothetical protein AmDm5_2871 [Acetobacter malorum]
MRSGRICSGRPARSTSDLTCSQMQANRPTLTITHGMQL